MAIENVSLKDVNKNKMQIEQTEEYNPVKKELNGIKLTSSPTGDTIDLSGRKDKKSKLPVILFAGAAVIGAFAFRKKIGSLFNKAGKEAAEAVADVADKAVKTGEDIAKKGTDATKNAVDSAKIKDAPKTATKLQSIEEQIQNAEKTYNADFKKYNKVKEYYSTKQDEIAQAKVKLEESTKVLESLRSSVQKNATSEVVNVAAQDAIKAESVKAKTKKIKHSKPVALNNEPKEVAAVNPKTPKVENSWADVQKEMFEKLQTPQKEIPAEVFFKSQTPKTKVLLLEAPKRDVQKEMFEKLQTPKRNDFKLQAPKKDAPLLLEAPKKDAPKLLEAPKTEVKASVLKDAEQQNAINSATHKKATKYENNVKSLLDSKLELQAELSKTDAKLSQCDVLNTKLINRLNNLKVDLATVKTNSELVAKKQEIAELASQIQAVKKDRKGLLIKQSILNKETLNVESNLKSNINKSYGAIKKDIKAETKRVAKEQRLQEIGLEKEAKRVVKEQKLQEKVLKKEANELSSGILQEQKNIDKTIKKIDNDPWGDLLDTIKNGIDSTLTAISKL